MARPRPRAAAPSSARPAPSAIRLLAAAPRLLALGGVSSRARPWARRSAGTGDRAHQAAASGGRRYPTSARRRRAPDRDGGRAICVLGTLDFGELAWPAQMSGTDACLGQLRETLTRERSGCRRSSSRALTHDQRPVGGDLDAAELDLGGRVAGERARVDVKARALADPDEDVAGGGLGVDLAPAIEASAGRPRRSGRSPASRLTDLDVAGGGADRARRRPSRPDVAGSGVHVRAAADGAEPHVAAGRADLASRSTSWACTSPDAVFTSSRQADHLTRSRRRRC